MIWDKPRILSELQKLHKSGADLSYNALAKRKQSLVSAAAYHFGSYRKAVEKAAIPYDQVLRRPRWTKQGIIALIKGAKRKNQDLHWSAVTKRRDELGKAAFASLQKRLFGRWDRALQAAGLDAGDVSMYRNWNKNSVLFEIRGRAAEKEALNSGALQKEDPGLHAAAVRYFGSYTGALLAAKLDPSQHRRRRSWDKSSVIAALKKAYRSQVPMSDSGVRRSDTALHGAAVRLFGSFTVAREAAGIPWKRGVNGTSHKKFAATGKAAGPVKRPKKTG